MPFTQLSEQQFAFIMHGAPFGKQGGGGGREIHLPMRQVCEQQSASWLHSIPSG